MAKRMTKEEKLLEARADRVASRACVGYQVPIMKLGNVTQTAKQALLDGLSEDEAKEKAIAFIKTIAL